MLRHLKSTTAAVLVVAAGLVLASGTPAAGAEGSITPWSSSVAVGATFSATANGCPEVNEETQNEFISQRAELVLITGSGAGERAAGFGRYVSENRVRFQVPGWVDPSEPAVVAGRCVRTTYSFTDDDNRTTTTVFAFADAPIDVTPGDGVPDGPLVALSRTTAAGGQVVQVSGSGCAASEYADVSVLEGGDLSGRTLGAFAAYASALVAEDGTFTTELALVRQRGDEQDGGGPLPEGPYSVFASCGTEVAFTFAEPQLLTVSGVFPSTQITVGTSGGEVTVAGTGCSAGETVTVRFDGYSFNGGFDEFLNDRGVAMAQRFGSTGDRLTPDAEGRIVETATTTAEPDGSWLLRTPEPASAYDLMVVADCGDPLTTGFRYVPRYIYEGGFADLYVERTSPTASPAGGQVTLHVFGQCEGAAAVVLLGRDGTVRAESPSFELVGYGSGSATLTAPNTPGEYLAAGRCDDQLSFASPYSVFSPEARSGLAPLPTEPTLGWPSEGAREVYEGRIGPITLPPMSDGGHGGSVAGKAMGPSALGIPVPRPDGDFAITSMSFDLVDGAGNPVGHEAAHLHHFVIANPSSKNPACPGGTFGLPGEIIAASGAERTVFETGDPYGLVVQDSDDWSGVYEVMSRSMQAQEVYLSYDLTFRRDVDNVRPLRPYFGSATGCGSFTWQIDGSGTPDVQSHHVEIASSGRLVGAGGHLHNGGQHFDLVNDRNRRLCRSELVLGDGPAHAPGHHRSQVSADDITETTVTVVGPAAQPPEFYDDDPPINGITTCGLAEQVSAGERLRVDATYLNERARSGVMGIYTFHVWEGGGPAAPGRAAGPQSPSNPSSAPAAIAVPGYPSYTG